jgi:ABC transporter substrate binding protein
MPARIRADFRRRNPPARRLQAFLPIEGMSPIGGTFETLPDVRFTAAFGGNPDFGEHRLRAEFDPQLGHGPDFATSCVVNPSEPLPCRLLSQGVDMRRREFIAILGGALAATSIFRPFTAHAQQKVWRIGLLLVGGPEFMGPYRTALRDLGYIEGKNIQIETRSAGGQIGRLPELAAELVHSKVDIIVASLTPAATAAKSATRDIPIIMAPAGDPIGTGLVTSLARPGGNVTGLSALGAELNSKNLEV